MARAVRRSAVSFALRAILTIAVITTSSTSVLAGPGEPDPTFGTGGYVTVPDYPSELAYDPTTAGFIAAFDDGTGTTTVRRYSSTGMLDGSFGVGGVATISGAPFEVVTPRDLVVDPTGRIIVGTTGKVVRLLPNGTPDVTFGTAGVASGIFVTALALQSDGSVVYLAGGEYRALILRRLTSSGVPDPTFGSGGEVVFPTVYDGFSPYEENGLALLVRADDRIVVAGAHEWMGWDHSDEIYLRRFLPDGSPDPTFGIGGKVYAPITPEPIVLPSVRLEIYPVDIAERSDGKLVVSGFTNVGTNPSIGIGSSPPFRALFLADGTLDPSFGSAGVAFVNDSPFSLMLGSDGTIVTAGSAIVGAVDVPSLVKMRANGAPEPGFGSCGSAFPDFGVGYSVNTASAVMEPDGDVVILAKRIVVAGGILARVTGGANDVSAEPDADADGIPDACDVCPAVADPTQANGDGDVFGDACDPCTGLSERRPAKALYKITKKGLPAGDERLTLTGTIAIPASPPINPVSTGVRLVLGEEEQVPSGSYEPTIAFDLLIPGGAYDTVTKTGWKANKTNTAFKYKGPSGITGVGINLKTGKDGVLRAKVKMIGKDLTLPPPFPVNGPGFEFAWLQLRGAEPSPQCGLWQRVGCPHDDGKMTMTCKWPF